MTRYPASLCPLVCHPDSSPAGDLAVRGGARVGADGSLSFEYAIDADLARLRIPTPGPSGRADRLWLHTCLEAFVAAVESAEYVEFNLSPSGQWQAYGFTAYRAGRIRLPGPRPRIECRVTPGGLSLRAFVGPAGLPEGRELRLGLAAVVEDIDGNCSYWALDHAPGAPDFHHPKGFALTMPHPPGRGRAGSRP